MYNSVKGHFFSERYAEMKLDKFLSFCGMMFAVIAVFFVSKVLLASAGDLLEATIHHSPTGWPSTKIISNMASHKADTWASVILICFAFVSQMWSLFVNSDVSLPGSMKKAVLMGIMLVVIVAAIIHQVSIGIRRSFETDIKKLEAKHYLKSGVEERSAPRYSGIEAIADQYFSLTRESDEEKADFLKRFAEYLDYDLPKNADLSKFK